MELNGRYASHKVGKLPYSANTMFHQCLYYVGNINSNIHLSLSIRKYEKQHFTLITSVRLGN